MTEQNLDDILSDEVEAETPEVEEPDEVEEVAEEAEPVEPEVEPEAEPEAEPEPEKAEEPQTVPVAALQEVRRDNQELKALLRGMQAQQPQPQPTPAPDVFEDPAGYQQHQQHAVKQMVTQSKLDTSRFLAEREFGKEAVESAVEYFNEHPEKSGALLNHPSPFHAAIDEFNQHRVAMEIGNDPAAYKEKLKAEIMAEVKAEMVAESVSKVAAPPSLAAEPNLGSASVPQKFVEDSLEDILGVKQA
ncbi:MAG: hypothetical protein ACPG4X_19365 [Pikeienuella sp.]